MTDQQMGSYSYASVDLVAHDLYKANTFTFVFLHPDRVRQTTSARFSSTRRVGRCTTFCIVKSSGQIPGMHQRTGAQLQGFVRNATVWRVYWTNSIHQHPGASQAKQRLIASHIPTAWHSRCEEREKGIVVDCLEQLLHVNVYSGLEPHVD